MQKKNLFKTLGGPGGGILSSVVNLSGLNVEKMEINVKEHNSSKKLNHFIKFFF